MVFGSLFSGIGGFDLGLERAGMTCAWQCEIDRSARNILHRQFGAPIIGDVRDVNQDTVPPVDLICGGFPCQDVSVAGKRAGLAGERSGLWFEFHRVVAELRPRWVVVENVPGLLSSNGGIDFAVILRGLVECGYGIAWRILDAQFFGVPQRRRRVFVVGSLGDGRAAEILFESEGVSWDVASSGATRPAVAGTLAPGTRAGGVSDREIGSGVYALTAHHGHLDPSEETFVFESRHARNGRGAPDVIAPPLDASLDQDIRRLTPTECERLQGFPDGWTAGQPDAARYRQLGNAVAIPVIEWIGRRIIACD